MSIGPIVRGIRPLAVFQRVPLSAVSYLLQMSFLTRESSKRTIANDLTQVGG